MGKVKLKIFKFIDKYWNLKITELFFNKNYRELLIIFLISICASLSFWYFLLSGELYILIKPYLILIIKYEFYFTMRIYLIFEDHFIYGTLIFLLFFVVNFLALLFIWCQIIFLFLAFNLYLIFSKPIMRFANFLTFGFYGLDPDLENYKDH